MLVAIKFYLRYAMWFFGILRHKWLPLDNITIVRTTTYLLTKSWVTTNPATIGEIFWIGEIEERLTSVETYWRHHGDTPLYDDLWEIGLVGDCCHWFYPTYEGEK